MSERAAEPGRPSGNRETDVITEAILREIDWASRERPKLSCPIEVQFSDLHLAEWHEPRSYKTARDFEMLRKLRHPLGREWLSYQHLTVCPRRASDGYEVLEGDRIYMALERIQWDSEVPVDVIEEPDADLLEVLAIGTLLADCTLSPWERVRLIVSYRRRIGGSVRVIARRLGITRADVDRAWRIGHEITPDVLTASGLSGELVPPQPDGVSIHEVPLTVLEQAVRKSSDPSIALRRWVAERYGHRIRT